MVTLSTRFMRISFLQIFILGLAASTSAAELPATGDLGRRHVAETMRADRYDEPDAAALYARLKRSGPTPEFDTVAAKERALSLIHI